MKEDTECTKTNLFIEIRHQTPEMVQINRASFDTFYSRRLSTTRGRLLVNTSKSFY